jgi:hypothetical protein
VAEPVEQRFRFLPTLPINERTQTIYLLGYWQVYNIAEKMAAQLRREFAFLEKPTGRNLDVLHQIESVENPVSLHIRRGDYTLQVEGNVALPMDYYIQAIEYLRAQASDSTFFIFSDDIEFARRNIGTGIRTVFVDHNDSFSAHEDLRLMSSCRHHIIANSSFSWWGAWLNPRSDKIVLAPRQWLVGNHPHYDDLFPPSWKLVDCL